MEIDDLKKIWNEPQPGEKSNVNIMEIIQHKNGGPLASLKRSYRKQIVVMGIMPALLVLSNFSNIENVLTSVVFWSYVLFCICVVIFARINFNIVAKMQGSDTMVRSHLDQQITLLEKRAKLEMIGFRSVLLYFVLLLEILPYFQHYRMLDTWHSLDPVIRMGSYLLLALFQYLMMTKVRYRKVGRHLENLKKLASQMA
jgi:hypothetical protein